MGWDPREAGLALLAMVLLVAAGLLPWWGVQEDASRSAHVTFRGVDFGPWMAEEWQLQVLPGAVRREGDAAPWWAYDPLDTRLEGYTTVAPFLAALWSVGLVTGALFVAYRLRPGPRRGWPTLVGAVASGSVLSALLLTVAVLPPAVGYPSFLGQRDIVQWGPRIGWFLALAVVALMGFVTWLGWRKDRALRGLCWKCYKEVEGEVCGYCGAAQ